MALSITSQLLRFCYEIGMRLRFNKSTRAKRPHGMENVYAGRFNIELKVFKLISKTHLYLFFQQNLQQ